MPTEEVEQTWNPPSWDEVAPRFQGLFPDIDPEEIRRRYESARELGSWRYRLRGAEETNTTAFLRSTDPFGVLAGRNAGALREASERFAQGRPNPGDAETIAVQERLQELDQNRGTASTIGRAVLGSATYGAEYMAGGALLRGASGLARGASAISNPSAASAIGGMVGRAGLVAAPHVWSETEQRRVPQTQRDEQGHAVGLPTQETSRTFWNALPAGSFDAFTEAFTEQLGGTRAFQALGRAPGALMERIGLGSARNLISTGVSRRLAQAGIHGPLSEMGEERAGELMRGLVLGDLMGEGDTYGATGQLAGAARSAVQGEGQAAQRQAGQALRQLFIEGAAFSIMQGGAHGLGHIMNARSGPEAALRAQIEAEVQRQQAQPDQNGQSGLQNGLSGLSDPDLAAAEAQINQRLSGQGTPQVQEQQQEAPPDQESAPEAPQSPATEPSPAEAQEPVQEPPSVPAEPQVAPAVALEDVRGIARQLGLDARGSLETLTRRVQGAGGQGLLDALVQPEATVAPERRQDTARRRRVAEMTPEERAQELLTSELTRLPNRRAFDEADPAPVVGMSDADGLKAFNDRFGYDAGNALLKAKADALRAVGLDAYHEKGDEFLYRGASPEEIGQKLEQARARLREAVIEVTMTDGTVKRFKGADFSYGVGNDLKSSETGLKAHKTEREARGERARGELRGIVEVGPQEGQVSPGTPAEAARKGLAALRRGGTRGLRALAVAQAAKDVKPGVREFKEPAPPEAPTLTAQEQSVLERRKRGESTRAIGKDMDISRQTVLNIEASARAKLGQSISVAKEALVRRQERAGQGEFGEVSERSNWGEALTEEDREAERMVGEFLASKPQEIEDAVKALQASGLSADAARQRATAIAEEEFRRGLQTGQAAEASIAGFGQPLSGAERASAAISGGQENATGATRPNRVTALANVVTREERKENKLPPIEQAARLEDAAVWDEAMERLRDDPQAAVRLVEELNKKPRATTVQENALLAHRRVSLANEHERATVAYINEFRKLKQADPAKLNELDVRERWLLDQVDQTDRAIVKAGTEWGRSGRWRRMLIAEDFTLAGMLLRAEAAKGRPLTQEEKAEILELNRKITELQKQLDQAIKEGKAKPGDPSDTDFELQKLQGEFSRGLKEDRQARDPWQVKALRTAGETVSIPKSLMASIDFPLFRQGMVAMLSHPVRTAKGIPEMFRSFLSEKVAERALYDIQHRPNAPLYEAAGLEITNRLGPLSAHEEGFMSRLMNWEPKNRIGRIGLKIATFIPKASERAYQTTLNRIRADSFDAMASALARKGELTTTEAKVLANYANIMTGRGQLGVSGEKAITLLNNVFFAPKWVASRFQMLVGQPIWTMQGGMAPRARLEVAKEYGRMLTGLGVVIGLAVAAGFDFEKDPRSTDFGKLKLGNTRLDLTGGLAGVGTFLARSAGGVKTQAGSVRPQTDRDIWGFVRQKLAPIPSAYFDLKTGRDAVHQPVTPGQVGLRRVTPLFVNEVVETMQEQGVPKGTAIAMLALMGMSTQTYRRR